MAVCNSIMITLFIEDKKKEIFLILFVNVIHYSSKEHLCNRTEDAKI